MNTVPRPFFSRQPRPFNVLPDPQPSPARREYRERDYGIGYGNSSGYAARRQYVSGWNGEPRFRCG